MSTEDISAWDKRCIVCGKSVEHGGGMCHIEVEGHMAAICCPLCMEAFNKNPENYVRRQEVRTIVGEALGDPDIFDRLEETRHPLD